MSNEVKIPSVGESITSGLLSTWHKKEGESVAVGDILLTLETDKVSTEITAEKAGVLHILVPEGQEVKVGAVVATIGAGVEGAPSPEAREEALTPPVAAAPVPAPQPAVEPVPAPIAPQIRLEAPPERAEEQVVSIEHFGVSNRVTRTRLSPLRRKIAAQLVMAQQTAAILTTFNECDMSAVMELRTRMQADFQKVYGIKLGFMSFFIKAAVKALKDVPSINGRIDGDDFVQNHYYDLGVAVGTERGLIVPVIRDADQKSFAEIERELAEYATKAREGKIKIEDLSGGVFTISNGGVYGSLLSTPILNPPQSGILGMHKIQQRPVAVGGEIVIRPMMYLALSYDHRVVDGQQAVTFLIRIKECIEDPIRLLFDL